jgi:hypothetical protein
MGSIRAVLQGHGDSVSIHATHEKAKQTPHGQELLEGAAVDGCNLQHSKHDHVNDHGPLTAEAVARETEKGGTDTPQQQGESDGRGYVSLRFAIVIGQLDLLDRERMEVKRICGPRGKTNEEEEPVTGTQQHEKTDRVLERLRVLPLRIGLALLVLDNNTLLPSEEVAPGLLRYGEDPVSDGLSRLVLRRHARSLK